MSEKTYEVGFVEDAQATLKLLRGEITHASVIPDENVRKDPTTLPSIKWECFGTFLGEAFGNLGAFYEDQTEDRTPTEAFNAGFIAARLALKEGLID